MSLAVDPVHSVKSIDPRVNFNRQKYLIQQGASQCSFRIVTSNNVSNNSVQFTCPPPNVNVAVDRKVFIEIPIEFTFTGKSPVPFIPGVPNLIKYGSLDALRSYPLSKICSTVQVVLNNFTVTTNISDYADALLHYNNELDTRCFELSGTPSMLDSMQNYSDFTLLGSGRNVLGRYGENSAENARGGYTGVSFVSTAIAGAGALTDTITEVFRAVIYEPLFISPLLFGQRESMGLYGIQTFDITLNFGDISYAWSHANVPGGVTDLTVAGTISGGAQAPRAHFNYLTPQVNQLLSPNCVYSYPYYSIDRYPTETGTSALAGGASSSVTSNNVQFSSIPRRVYVFLRRTPTSRNFTKTDTYARIDKVSINFNNKSGLLSSGSSFDLHHMSVRNGLKSSWDQWNGYQGSILCLDFARDMSLGPLEVPGVLGTYQFQIQVDYTNVNPFEPILYQCMIVAVSEGMFTVDKQTSMGQIGVVAPEEILNDNSIPIADYYAAMQGANFYGGAFMDTVKKYGKKALSGLNAVLPALSAAAPFLPGSVATVPALRLAEKYIPKLINAGATPDEAQKLTGSGYGEADLKSLVRRMKAARGGAACGGSFVGSGLMGGAAMGGRLAGKQRMQRRLQGL
jgi:hypothetical protein